MKMVPAKRVLTKVNYDNYSWFGLDYNMNLYRGCSHGCIYCDSRSDCYHIEDFDQVGVKENVIEILKREISSKRKKGVIAIGAMSDTYNPLEKSLCLTRQALEIIYQNRFGLSIDTKSDLIIRDIDLIKKISDNNSTIIKITITSSNDELSKKIEPYVCPSSSRFKAIKELSDAGIFVGILLHPVLPFITDNEENIISIVRMAHESGAKFIHTFMGVTLRQNQRDYYYNNIEKLFPAIKEKYIKTFGERYCCNSIDYEKLFQIFRTECEKYGILYKMKDIINAYKKELKNEQISLFNIN